MYINVKYRLYFMTHNKSSVLKCDIAISTITLEKKKYCTVKIV